MGHSAFLGLGSNLGDRAANIRAALAKLAARVSVEAVSSFYETDPVGYAAQPRFVNAVCRGATALESEALLAFIKGIEVALGRQPSARFGPRLIDIDILLYDDLVLETATLTLPHPRLAERAFVLLPLAELAPGLVHPVLGETIAELAARISGKEGVVRIEAAEPPRTGSNEFCAPLKNEVLAYGWPRFTSGL